MSTPEDDVMQVVRDIPRGTVMSYGQVADLAGGYGARNVGYMLGKTVDGDHDFPWHRVVGSDGTLRIAKRAPEYALKQKSLLSSEGVTFLKNNRVDMDRHQVKA